ncbi:MAG: hypothetical protein V3U37_07750, partial [Nitrospinaceae bacterium]
MVESATQNPPMLPCECCGNESFSTVCDRKNGSVVRCMECGLEFVNPLPSEEHLEENYAQEMKSDAKGTPYFLEYIN